jgi:5'-3' exonuclease
MNHLLVLDMSNVLYKSFFAKKDAGHGTPFFIKKTMTEEEQDDIQVRHALHTSILSLNKFYKELKPTKMVCVFDRFNWRDDYSKSDECYSKRAYKGNRRQSMTPSELKQYQMFKQFTVDFEKILRDTTSMICLSANLLEADDLIAGVCRIYGGDDQASDNGCIQVDSVDDHDVTIVSSDKDMIQLMRYERVKLVDPATMKYRTLENNGYDSVDYYLYHKYMRGDSGDNVLSAYPRYRSKKIREAFEDPYQHTNLMNCEWTDHEGRVMVVGKIFEENKILTNLTHQPRHVQDIMFETIQNEFSSKQLFDRFRFTKMLNRNQLKYLSKNIDYIIPMLSLK